MPYAVVTGASSGIGLSIARQLAARKFDIVLSARSAPALERLASELTSQTGVSAVVCAADLARADGPASLVESIAGQGIRPDILVNNAGFGTYGMFADQTLQSQLEMIQVNVTSLVELTHRLLPGMLARRSGRILNVASTAAFQPGPLMAVYYASKSFVLNFSEALGNEVQDQGVTVTALCPGPTTTGFQDRAQLHESRLMKSAPMMTADEVAAVGLDALFAGKPLVIPGVLNRVTAWSTRLAPRSLATKMARLVQERA